MRFFHRTTKEAAEQILREGFRNRTGYYGFSGMEITGTWLSHVPVDSNEGAKGDVLLVVDLNVLENEIADFEVQDAERCYREWAIPAPLINSRGSGAELVLSDLANIRRDAPNCCNQAVGGCLFNAAESERPRVFKPAANTETLSRRGGSRELVAGAPAGRCCFPETGDRAGCYDPVEKDKCPFSSAAISGGTNLSRMAS